MISVEKAEEIIRNNTQITKTVVCRLGDSFGRLLREDIKADRDLPPFHKSVVDGIAIKMSSYENGNRQFKIEGTLPAGKKPKKLKSKNNCIEIMTGAALPAGCDCVIPVEQIQVYKNQAVVADGLKLKAMQFVRLQGADHKAGDVLVKAGAVLLPPQVLITASVGQTKVKVDYRPAIAIIGTGNELVGLRKRLSLYHVRNSNSHAILAALAQNGYKQSGVFLVKDDKKHIYRMLEGVLKLFDVVILSGGVSMGKFDFIPGVLEQLGVKVLFHKVNQRPGKPFWFGKNKQGKVVFALPGNPVSTQVCTYRYVLPYLRRASGLIIEKEEVALGHSFQVHNEMTNFLPVKLSKGNNRELGHILSTGGSGDFSSLGPSDGFVELASGRKNFKSGVRVPLYRWA